MADTADRELTGYSPADYERLVPEDRTVGRSEFARDRARVLHCSAFRRLAAKTQVVMAGQEDFPRTRLTHTLEVAQIARELGRSLGAHPDVVDTAGLAHDLGHPPFGHNGEEVLHQLSEAIGGFEGNAQSLRVLTRLEFKVMSGSESAGLNLTRASLDATIKYPWPREADQTKFNVYADDLAVFDWIRADAPPGRRCFEAQIMDWSDDVAYCVHDLEDAVFSAHFHPGWLLDSGRVAEIVTVAQQWYRPEATVDQLQEAAQRIAGREFWPITFQRSGAGLAHLKQATSSLIRRFCTAALDATRAEAEVRGTGSKSLTRYAADLVVPEDTRDEVAVLKAITARYVMQRPGSARTYAAQQELLTDLVSALRLQAPMALDAVYQQAWEVAEDDEQRFRVIIDQVASLTDVSVVKWHNRLCT